MKNVIYFLIFISFSSFAQQKDSLKVLQSLKEVPEKYKLEHFGVKGKVKSFEEFFGMPSDNTEMYYDFDEKGNLLKITNHNKIVIKEFTYDDKGILKSYKTNKYKVEVEVDENENIIKQRIYKKDRDTATVVNTYNDKGFWTMQTHLETNQKMLEHKYDKNNKMIEIIPYLNGKQTGSIKLTYKYFKRFIQVCHNETYFENNNFTQSYFYIDYFGNELHGFPFDKKKPSQHEINEFFAVYKIDENKNWFKTTLFQYGMGSRMFTYY